MRSIGLKNKALDQLVEHDVIDLPVITEGDDIVLCEDVTALLVEGDLDKAMRRLQVSGWRVEGRTSKQLVDMARRSKDFIRHELHVKRLLKGGTDDKGKPIAGGGGLRWGGLLVKDGEAALRVYGSFEYGPDQKIYQQTIKFANFKKIAGYDELNWLDKARLLVRDRLKVHCDCPAYRFFYNYTANQKGFGLYPELRPAGKTNPRNNGGICKHLHVALQYMGGQHAKIASELKQALEKPKKPVKKKTI